MSLLRYFEGATPKRKAPKQPEAVKDAKKRYEKDRKRTFQESWKAGRPWLVFSEEKGTLGCTMCREFSPHDENNYIKGSSYLRVDGIKSHEVSECHRRSESKHHAKARLRARHSTVIY